MSERGEPRAAGDFSLVLGGPLYQLLLKSRLARPPVDLLRRRVAVLTLLAWLPLLVLSAIGGVAFSGVPIPFLKDLDAQVRLLVALPLLLAAEKVVHERIGPAVALFRGEGVVPPGDAARFAEIEASTMRWRNSFVVELCLLAVAFTMGHTVWTERLALHKDVWFASATPSGFEFSRAGLWYAWFSLPLFQFLLLRWWYRLLLWFRFLFLVSRLNLNLSPSHPDRAGGLGFLGDEHLRPHPGPDGPERSRVRHGRHPNPPAGRRAHGFQARAGRGARVRAPPGARSAAGVHPRPREGQAARTLRVRDPLQPLRGGIRSQVDPR